MLARLAEFFRRSTRILSTAPCGRPRVTRGLSCSIVSLILATIVGQSILAEAASVPVGFQNVEVLSGLQHPTAMAIAPDGRLFVCEQAGKLRVIKGNVLLPAPFAAFTVDQQGERGLLGVAFDPQFASNHFVYVYYTATTPNVHNRVSRLTANGDVMVPGSEVILFELDELRNGIFYHNGGALHFGLDGALYIAVGDNAMGTNAQTLTNVLGKILRINRDGTIPPSNPFMALAAGKSQAIWAMGLRNPFTFAIHPISGRILINDVGEHSWEEIDDGVAGANYGWPTTEGATNDPNFRGPLYTYSHADGCAITGGTFYHPATSQFPNPYVDSYFFADFCGKWIKQLDPSMGKVTAFVTGLASPIDLEVAPDGSLFYLLYTGAVGKIQFLSGQQPQILTQPTEQTVGTGQMATFLVSASGTEPLSYEWRKNNQTISGAASTMYTTPPAAQSDNGAVFQCAVGNTFGAAQSTPVKLTVTGHSPVATITAPVEGTLYQAGDTIAYSATATDAEDGELPAGAFTWVVNFHHDTHFHPFMPSTTESKSGSFVIPTVGETSSNVWYRITLTVTDSSGLTHTTFRDVKPKTAMLTLATVPPGLPLTLDGQPVTTPTSVVGVAGLSRQIGAALKQTVGAKSYEWVSWSDGQAAAHTLPFPAANATVTATYREVGASTPPKVTMTSPPENGKLEGPTIDVVYTSGGDLEAAGARYAYLQFDNDPGQYRDLNGSFKLLNVKPGAHVIDVYLVMADHTKLTRTEFDRNFSVIAGSTPPPPPVNQPPTLSVGTDLTITLPATANLMGTASDDGLPNPPGKLTTTWLKISGPGAVTFGDANALTTTASFSEAGTYALRLTVTDGALERSDKVHVTVKATEPPPTPTNQPPTVTAGADQSITLPATASLAGTASDDGLPNPPAHLTTTWIKISGPGTVSFGNASALTTTASFSMPGTYALRLTVTDGALERSDELHVTVKATEPPSPAPVPSPVPPPPTGRHVTLTIEAEAGTLTAPLAKIAVANAMGGFAIASPTGDAGLVLYTLTVPVSGDYVLWGRVLAPRSNADSFYVSVDGGPEDIYDVAEHTWSSSWQWTRVNGRDGKSPLTLNPRIFSLAAGAHTFRFRVREAGTTLDALIVTNDRTFVPSDGSLPPAPTPAPAPTLELTATPSTITVRSSSVLAWTFNRTVGNCLASGGWSGERPLSGQQVVQPTETTTYRLVCRSGVADEPAIERSVTVTVKPISPPSPSPLPPLVLEFSANPSTVKAGQSTALTWNLNRPSGRCEASSRGEGWSGERALSGQQSVTPTMTTLYYLECRSNVANEALVKKSVTVTVTDAQTPPPPANQPPTVSAGADQTITLPAVATLTGTATDDGLPNPPGQLSVAWSKVSGPASVAFGNSGALHTTVGFSVPGTYALRLTVSDGGLERSDELHVTVTATEPPTPTNQPPVVSAGADQTLTLPATATLVGTASDDGLPNPPGKLTTTWIKISGPGTVSFGNASALTTTASFSMPGTYALRLTVTDGALERSDELHVTVKANEPPPPPTNQPPTVNAGADLTITLPATASLAGTATDDSLPNPPAHLTTTWSKVSGPGTVSFGNMNALATTATFSTAGTYVLRLSATDGAIEQGDVLQVIVQAATPPPVGGRRLNVMDYGAKGDGTAQDHTAIQKALDAAKPGDTVYVPTGRYLLGAPLHLYTSNVTVEGDGDASVIVHGTFRGLDIGYKDQSGLSGVTVRKLAFFGVPGKYLNDGNTSHAILMINAQNCRMEYVTVLHSGNGIYGSGTTYGTVIDHCKILGWGSVGLGLKGGEHVSQCELIQDDPDIHGGRSSHGIYIHAGSHDVLIEDTLIQNCRKYALHQYGEAKGMTIPRITFRRVTVKDCANGLVLANYPGDAARAQDMILEDSSFINTYDGAAISLKEGDRLIIRNNMIDGGNIGVGLGRWAPWEPNWGLISDLTFSNNTVRNCNYGMMVQASNGGHFINVQLLNNTVTGNRTRDWQLYNWPIAGVTIDPPPK